MTEAFAAVELGILDWENPADADRLLDQLDERRRVLLVAGASYHALLHPDSRIELVVEDSGSSQMALASDAPAISGRRRGTLVLTTGDAAVKQNLRRRVVLPSGDISEPPWPPPPTLKARALLALERAAPIWGDVVRQRRNTSQRARSDAVSRPVRSPAPARAWRPSAAPRAVIFGMYWLGRGGAEAWALRTIERTVDAGLVPVVVTDVPGVQELAGDGRLRGAIVLVLDDSQHPRTHELLDALARAFDIRAAFVHHSNWLYGSLPALRRRSPEIEVVDTTHVIEWSNGGFPMVAGRADADIDVHHVISRELVDYLRDVEGVDAAKIVHAPLSAAAQAIESVVPPSGDRPFTVGFVGRFVPQKRPLLFLATLRRLRRQPGCGEVRGIMHGGGPLEEQLRDRIARWGLADAVELRSPEVDVRETYRCIDALLVSSQVEGLTLTTMEATAAGIPVVSAEVGAQAELVVGTALVPRAPRRFIAEASAVLARLVRDAAYRGAVVGEQQDKLAVLRSRTTADEWFEETLRRWTR